MSRIMARPAIIKRILALVIVTFFILDIFLLHQNHLLNEPVASTPNVSSPATTVIPEASAPVPEEYFSVTTPTGYVETFTYHTYDYTKDTPESIDKKALVYLPPGYDTSGQTRYDIIYWLHGWQMTNKDYFQSSDDATVHILDHLINQGKMKPVIVVSLTFDRYNTSQDWERSVAEISVFDQEVRHDLLPQLESVYPTYATSSAEVALVASREHRAFGGFSLGAVATWYEYERNLDLFQYFVPMSGDSWTISENGGLEATAATVNRLAEIASNSGRDFYIVQTNGTQDIFYEQIDAQLRAMIARAKIFTPRNLAYLVKEDGEHDMIAIWEMTYSAFPRLFR